MPQSSVALSGQQDDASEGRKRVSSHRVRDGDVAQVQGQSEFDVNLLRTNSTISDLLQTGIKSMDFGIILRNWIYIERYSL